MPNHACGRKTAAVMLTLMTGAIAAPPIEDLVVGTSHGPWRRLFLDAMVVERQQGLERVFHAAKRHEGNPVLPFDKPWEGSQERGTGPYLYGTVMWDEGKLRMWYHCYHRGHGAYFNMYAESDDGLHWRKPSLGLVEFNGSTENNLVVTTSPKDAIEEPDLYRGGGKCHNPSVIKRPWESAADRRYVLFCYAQEYRHARMAYSPDGLRWTFVRETARNALFASSDVLNFFHDPYRSRYVCTFKTGNRRGRAAGVALSRDGVTWTKPCDAAVFVADDLDPDATQIYGMPVFAYQGLYVGLPWVYNARWFKSGSYTAQTMYEAEKDSPCSMDVQLAWSWDLLNWTRPPRRDPFIPRGGEGAFDSHMNYSARAPIQMGDELWFYYGGFNAAHNSGGAKSAIGLATLRLDGFCCLRAGDEEGWLVSRRERMMVPKVTVNAQVRDGGALVAEILDQTDTVIPGFSRDDCLQFSGDSVRHALTWRTDRFPAERLSEVKKLRFILKKADLYSYIPDLSVPAEAIEPATVIYDPAANGGLLPNHGKIPAAQQFNCGGDPKGYRVVREGDFAYLDLHSAAVRRSQAACRRDHNWVDETDWCLETWLRVVDEGDEPNYGLAISMRPDEDGRNVALYLSDQSVGFNSTSGPHDHRTLKAVSFNTMDGFHWYRMVHAGGANGTVALEVDGKALLSIPMSALYPRVGSGANIMFGPNAAHREGRMHVAKFGYRIGSTESLFGPVPGRE